MSRPIITIHDLATDEIIEREMNDEEFEIYNNNLQSAEKEKLEAELSKNERQKLLDKLGITAEEAALLLS